MRAPRLAGLVALAALAIAACGTGGASVPSPADAAPDTTRVALPVTVRSADGRDVEITDVDRIVPLSGNIAEVVFDLGLGANVVGRDVSATFAEAGDLPLVTRGHDVSAESVLSLRPTLVIADEDTGPPEALDHLRNVGVPVVVLDRPESVGDIEGRIDTIATVLGVPGAGADVIADTKARLADVRAAIPADVDPPTVAFLYLRGTASVYLLGGPGAGTDSMIEQAGGIDAGTAMGLSDAFTPITSEAMVKAAPDVLLLTTTGLESVGGADGLLSIPGVAQTPAGKNRRVVAVEDGLLFSFGSRTPEALADIIEQLYP
ncbi:heme/hemin ABC transporter substrate-binding protein [Actinospongicola halichondriae]|uniref:heme/hemin ABC transporter substrate-binding protein n=1 Tax=Actinospongicola halichondriae TaxID=3236844 RepID=UPI003D3E60B1